MLIHENNLLTSRLGDERLGEGPQGADSLGVEDVGFHGVATIIEVHGGEDFVEVTVGYLSHVHITEVEDVDVFLCVEGDVFEAQHDQHEKVDGIIVLVDGQGVVKAVSPDDDYGLHGPVVAI